MVKMAELRGVLAAIGDGLMGGRKGAPLTDDPTSPLVSSDPRRVESEMMRLLSEKREFAMAEFITVLNGSTGPTPRPHPHPDVRASAFGHIAGILSGELSSEKSRDPEYLFRQKFEAVRALSQGLEKERDSGCIGSMCNHVKLLAEARLGHAQNLIHSLGKLLERDGLKFSHSDSVCSALETILTMTADPNRIAEIREIAVTTARKDPGFAHCKGFQALRDRLDLVTRAVEGRF